VRHIEAEGNPTNGEILIAVLDADLRIVLYRWDGFTFEKQGILETNAANDKWMAMDILYEQQSGEGMIVWGNASSSSIQYVTTNGSCVSLPASLPSFPAPTAMVRASADPTSDTIFLMALTLNNNIYAAVWDGTSWTDSRCLETNPDQPSMEYMNFDVAWEDSGSEAIAAWGKSSADHAVRYFRWLKGTALSGGNVEIGPRFQNYLRSMQLSAVPGSDRIVMACNNNSKELRYCLWDGDQFRGDPAVLMTDKQPSERWLPFDVAHANYRGDLAVPPKGVVPGLYVEARQGWYFAGGSDSWVNISLSGPPYNVPADAVLELAITNIDPNSSRSGGIRRRFSTLDRRFRLHEAEGGGKDAVVMHVQADDSSRIECYVGVPYTVVYFLLGYWTDGTYVERFDSFSPTNSGIWEDHNLGTYGVGPDQVAEIVIVNNDPSNERSGGVRTDGSGLERRVTLHEAEDGGLDLASMLVKAGGDANATIEVWAQSVSFCLVGHWSDPPGTYIESFDVLGSPAADQTWEKKNLSGHGVPAEAVVQIALANQHDGGANNMGLRKSGSSLDRTIDLHEAEDGGDDMATFHVKADGCWTIEWYHQDVSDDHAYYLLGYWDAGQTTIESGFQVVLEADFDADAEGFTYADDTFRGTSEPAYATGVRIATGGHSGGALKLDLGDLDNSDVLEISGGWGGNFTASGVSEVVLSFRYNLTLAAGYEVDEFGQVLIDVDGTLCGKDPYDYVYQINGNGDGGSPDTSGWRLFKVNLGTLSSGTHNLIIGGYNNKKTWSDESTTVLIDDVLITEW
jgi:hypothetical protein